MVKTRDVHDFPHESHFNIDKWLLHIGAKLGLSREQLRPLQAALELSQATEQKVRADAGDAESHRPSAFLTGVEMAEILADLGLHDEGLVAAVLYRHVRERHLSLPRIEKEFGPVVALLIENVLQLLVQPVASREELIQVHLAQHAPEGRLREL